MLRRALLILVGASLHLSAPCQNAWPADGDHVAWLAENLKSDDAVERRDAIRRIQGYRFSGKEPRMDELLSVLFQAFKDPDKVVRASAPAALNYVVRQISVANKPELVKLLEDDNRQVRSIAAYSLMELDDDASDLIPQLVDKVDATYGTKDSYAISVHRFLSRCSDGPLSRYFGHPDERVRRAIVGQFSHRFTDSDIRLRFVELLKSTHPEVRKVGIDVYSVANPAWTGQLTKLRDSVQDPSPEVSRAAVKAFAKVPSVKVAPLLEYLQDPKPHVMAQAVRLISEQDLEEPRVILALIEGALNKNEEVAHACIDSVGRLKIAKGESTLLQIIEDPNSSQRYRALESLRKLDTKPCHTVPTLLAAFRASQDSRFRRELAETLGKLGPHARIALDDLYAAIDPNDESMSLAALQAILTLDPSDQATDRVVGAFGKLLHPEGPDSPKHGTVSVPRAIAEIGPRLAKLAPELTSFISKTKASHHRRHALNALKSIGTDSTVAVPTLVSLLESDQEVGRGVRGQIYEVLALAGPSAKDAVPALIAALDKNHPGEEVILAIRCLGAIGSDAKAAIPAIERFAKRSYGTEKADAQRVVTALGGAQ